MQIRSLQVRNFRNLHHVDVDFSPGLNVIHGANAQGKTNLLEAVYVLVTGRSFRATSENEIIPWSVEEYAGTLIRAEVRKRAGDEQLAFYFDGKNKRVLVNGTPITRLASLVGRLNAVLFTPADLLLVRGAPALRRRFLDIAIGQTSPAYLNALQTYQQVLKNRNALLKSGAHRGAEIDVQLDVYDQQLASAGAVIMAGRETALAELSVAATAQYASISGQAEPLDLSYEPSVEVHTSHADQIETVLAATYLATRAEDRRRLITNSGPHRDDFRLNISTYSARQFASQGQQRSAVLALKFAEMQYLHSHTGELPLLMLDDVISELDDLRQTSLLRHLDPAVQTFITTTDPDNVTRHAEAQRLLKMESGKLL